MTVHTHSQSRKPAICVVIPAPEGVGDPADMAREVQRHCPVIIVGPGQLIEPVDEGRQKDSVIHVPLPAGSTRESALRQGLAKACEMEFSHAVTMNWKVHAPGDVPLLLDAVGSDPEAVWIGVGHGGLRPQAGITTRVALACHRLAFRINTDISLSNPSSTFRAYPLHYGEFITRNLARKSNEHELLIDAAWSGIPLRELTVRTSDVSTRTAGRSLLGDILLPLRLFVGPGKSRAQKITALVRHELRAHATPRRAAASLAAGVFIGFLPIYGFQVMILMGLSFLFRINRPLALLGVCVTSPPLVPIVAAAALGIGRLVLCLPFVNICSSCTDSILLQSAVAFALGSAVLALVGAPAAYLVAWPLFAKLLTARRQSAAVRSVSKRDG